MTSSVLRTESTPLYFFDQPTKRDRDKGARLCFNLAQEEDAKQREKGNKAGDDKLSGETRGAPDSLSAVNRKTHDLMEAYKRAAPQLLKQVALLLSQHDWTEEGLIPQGIENILTCPWEDPPKTNERVSADDNKREAAERNSRVVGNVSARKPQVSSNPQMKKHKLNSTKAAQTFTTTSFSLSSDRCSNAGWIIQQKQPSYDEPEQQIRLCQWVLEKLRAATSAEKLQTAEQDLNLIFRYYGDPEPKLKDRRARKKVQPATLVNGMPQIPEVKQQDPEQQKLHYKINNGSSFIYYPSGCIAVCQSHSGLPCRGFYTNVFSDSECPVILATITAFGHGAVTHPHSSAITAVWDQHGGFICDHHGDITKEWSWQTDRTQMDKIVIQLSDVISVRLLSGTSAMLSFRCNNESIQLPLSALSNINQPQEMTERTSISDSAQDFLPVSVCSQEILQMVGEVEEPSAPWRSGEHVGSREVKKLQQRARNTLDDWLDYYRVAVGIKCLNVKRMPDGPLRTRLRSEVESDALPSLNPPERVDAKLDQPEEMVWFQLRDLCGRNSDVASVDAPTERSLDSCVKLPRTRRKRTKEEEPCVTQIGLLQIHGSIKLEDSFSSTPRPARSGIIPKSADLQPFADTRCPAPPSLYPPCIPLTVCPAWLRASLLGEGGHRRCCCSATLMPAVTDLEYDAFVMGQPPHSQQILVVCVTPQPRQAVNAHAAVSNQDVLEQLYRRRNKHRTMPCTQCQMDSFRLVRYEMSSGEPSWGDENILLQQQHNVTPGMVLMYIRGKLLFVGQVFSGDGCSVRDLQEQISKTRGDYRSGLSLPADYKFRDVVEIPAAKDAHNSQDATLQGGDDTTPTAPLEKGKASERKNNPAPEVSNQRQREFCIKPKETPALPHVPVITH
ncbi:uncharacterized protein C3orf20-like isoform X1 [Sebastes fasciatus]|uniref:uncharacterized protein C3orf20-like isoform X1 n=1 Tax=Sebastes fasciatus TaxID=394691 RepID=UPI003D9F220A